MAINALFAILSKIIYILLVPLSLAALHYQCRSNIWHLKCLALKIPDRIVITCLKHRHSFKKNYKKKENFKVSATRRHEIDPQPKQLYAPLS